MREFIFFILGGVIGVIGGTVYGGVNMAVSLAKNKPTKQDVEEFKREVEAVNTYAKATTKTMHH